jgi:hypothetical protein
MLVIPSVPPALAQVVGLILLLQSGCALPGAPAPARSCPVTQPDPSAASPSTLFPAPPANSAMDGNDALWVAISSGRGGSTT